ncbi:hypothetical protein SAMN05216351_10434 [Pseudobutyrivibrio sp. JW11]|uniref:hypothetical protein n=1 Tax=Pseudobutyrivibrio sp. JW11 TaxID=1855302 RepID=UPI0008E4DD08|nr:hypothetical protein [Pseudobutyrivibrio sp. JW11]SFO17382.1 hypothetical protein SAMN05216351_10434 [Pseudobutyrivibrio sp. JW11]
MTYSLKDIKHAIEIVIEELYPYSNRLIDEYSNMDDIANQIVFELIKEDYKKNAKRNSVQFYLNKYDIEASNRKYTRAIQHAQHYRDSDYDEIKDDFGVELDELLAEDVSGKKVFEGHHYTEKEYWELKMQAECKLLSKLHQKQIVKSKNVSEPEFKRLFEEYRQLLDDLEPAVNDYNGVICKTLVFYGLETYFLIDYIYSLCLAAEKKGFPDYIPIERMQSVCSITQYIDATDWCPNVYIADYCMLLKWDSMSKHIFEDSNEEWREKIKIIYDCKQLKNIMLQRHLDDWIRLISACSIEEKARFIINNYWIWDKRVDYEWTSDRIKYYRKIYQLLMKDFEKPHIK